MKKSNKQYLFCRNPKSPFCGRCGENVILRSLYTHVISTLVKFIVGVLTGSQVLLADAIHSISDTISFGVNYVGVRQEKASKRTQSILIGSLMFLSGVWILADNVAILIADTPVHPGLVSTRCRRVRYST